MQLTHPRVLFLTLAALTVSACNDAPIAGPGPLMDGARFSSDAQAGATSDFVILANGALSSRLAESVAAAGGELTAVHPQIGVALARSNNPEFAMRVGGLSGIQAVVPDMMVAWTDPNIRVEELETSGSTPAEAVASIGDAESFFPLQWSAPAISLPEAWNAGARGAGVRIAILDGGIYHAHADIAPNLDVAASASMVPGQPFNADVGTFWHGTHVAGIAAGAANGIGTVGVAPEATIVGVKVLHSGSGQFGWIINGIMYAGTPQAQGGAGADVINMSLRGAFFLQGSGAAHLQNAISRATTYATQQGVTVIAAAGNDFLDLDHTANVLIVPAQSANVVTVSATSPVGWALNPSTADVDLPASYTNFGRSAIDLAAPGGDFAYPGNETCNVAGIVVPCWVFDGVMAACRGQPASTTTFCWANGTSMAAPHVAGVAALIIEKNGGPMNPAHVLAKLRASVDDLGQPGQDPYYGRGRLNALRAIQ